MNTMEKSTPEVSPTQLPLAEIAGMLAEQPSSSGKVNLTAQSSLTTALDAFEKYMKRRGFTENTQQAFRLDMELLIEYLGAGEALSKISTANLKAFLTWMEYLREVPCSPKTLERRITTLKVFFGWLTEEELFARDPSAPLIHHTVSAPLPAVLADEQLQAVLAATQALRQGDEEHDPDSRPHLLVTLLLHTGIKKGECVRIALNHIDLTDREHPALWIRYQQANRRHKERRIALPVRWPNVLATYQQEYAPQQLLFPWTARNLEYVLAKVAKRAAIPRLSFEMLRWTCAVRDKLEGLESEELRRKLGLSQISWYEVEGKLELLAQQLRGTHV
ncbi:MAG TPA: site-specific integrase [Thermoflexia bacterium]|nr:site-specific integrase [Thermoflexia bacterium]